MINLNTFIKTGRDYNELQREALKIQPFGEAGATAVKAGSKTT